MAYMTRDVVHYTTGNSTGFLSGAIGAQTSTTAYSGSKWAGSVGSTAYTVGDVVTALKIIGVLAE